MNTGPLQLTQSELLAAPAAILVGHRSAGKTETLRRWASRARCRLIARSGSGAQAGDVLEPVRISEATNQVKEYYFHGRNGPFRVLDIPGEAVAPTGGARAAEAEQAEIYRKRVAELVAGQPLLAAVVCVRPPRVRLGSSRAEVGKVTDHETYARAMKNIPPPDQEGFEQDLEFAAEFIKSLKSRHLKGIRRHVVQVGYADLVHLRDGADGREGLAASYEDVIRGETVPGLPGRAYRWFGLLKARAAARAALDPLVAPIDRHLPGAHLHLQVSIDMPARDHRLPAEHRNLGLIYLDDLAWNRQPLLGVDLGSTLLNNYPAVFVGVTAATAVIGVVGVLLLGSLGVSAGGSAVFGLILLVTTVMLAYAAAAAAMIGFAYLWIWVREALQRSRH